MLFMGANDSLGDRHCCKVRVSNIKSPLDIVVRKRKVQRPSLILAPLFFMINSPVTGVVITQVPVPVTMTITLHV